MRIVVMGGSGRVGSRVVPLLRSRGHDVVDASRHSGVDVVTGAGLTEALRGASVVIDVTNAASFESAAAMSFFTTATGRLLDAEIAAAVGHHVLLSVAGAGGVPDSGYLQAKVAQERLVTNSGLPYSIVRSTQFFEFLEAIADEATHAGLVRLPPVHVQPIAAADVARSLARIANGPPLNGVVELGGPDPFYLDALIQRLLGMRGDARTVTLDRHASYFGAVVGDRSLVAGDEADIGPTRFEDWLALDRPPRGPQLGEHTFCVGDLPPGSVLLLGDVAVFNVEGGLCATQARCTHRQGPLSEGTVDGSTVTCPLHGARFNVWSGAVLRGPATTPLKTYAVTVEGDIGRVEVQVSQEA